MYLEFLISDEGQFLTYHGIEGEHYNMVDGLPKKTPKIVEAWKNVPKMAEELGIFNGNFVWFPTNWIDQLYYFWGLKDVPAYGFISRNYSQHAENERMNEITHVPSDSEEKVIETKVFELWKTSLPLMYLANSEEECIAAYETFIQKAERLGLAKLEAGYTEDYRHWQKVLGKN